MSSFLRIPEVSRNFFSNVPQNVHFLQPTFFFIQITYLIPRNYLSGFVLSELKDDMINNKWLLNFKDEHCSVHGKTVVFSTFLLSLVKICFSGTFYLRLEYRSFRIRGRSITCSNDKIRIIWYTFDQSACWYVKIL